MMRGSSRKDSSSTECTGLETNALTSEADRTNKEVTRETKNAAKPQNLLRMLMVRKLIAHVIREVYPPLAGEIRSMTQGRKE